MGEKHAIPLPQFTEHAMLRNDFVALQEQVAELTRRVDELEHGSVTDWEAVAHKVAQYLKSRGRG